MSAWLLSTAPKDFILRLSLLKRANGLCSLRSHIGCEDDMWRAGAVDGDRATEEFAAWLILPSQGD